jgi:EAL domain-containing protein (putative c-di-GMP-specific phosphodiesterase class I)
VRRSRETQPGVPQRARVLVADDDEGLRRSYTRLLERDGHEVIAVADGQSALAVLADRPVDAVLSDLSMPVMDGIQLLQAIRARDGDLPVLLVTGSPSLETAMAAVSHGAAQYLLKPVDGASLSAAIHRAIQLHRVAMAKRQLLELRGASTLASDRIGLEASLVRAIEGMWLVFQPIVRENGALFGYETLMRSSEPDLPGPVAVLQAAEALGRLVDVGRRVRRLAARALSKLPDDVVLFVNVHPRELEDPVLGSELEPLTAHAGRVVLEMTERASLHAIDDVHTRVTGLRAHGYRVAIDDLGAGYAGLSSFALLEPEIVKIDMSLVRDVHQHATKLTLVRSLAQACHQLGMQVVAEGIESVEERDALLGAGCTLFQGYHFGRPEREPAPGRW